MSRYLLAFRIKRAENLKAAFLLYSFPGIHKTTTNNNTIIINNECKMCF